MKKFAKVSAIIAVILIVLGGTIAIAAGLCGGNRAVRKMAENNELAWNFGDMHIRVWDGSILSIGNEHTDMRELSLEEISAEGAVDKVKSIHIEAGGGTIRFLESEDDKISILADKSIYRIYEKGETLYILGEAAEYDWYIGFGDGIMSDAFNLDIYLPAGKVYEDVVLEFGGGKVELGSLKAENMMLSAGAATIEAERLEVADTFEIELGAGKISVEDGIFRDVITSVGAGKVDITGSITGDLAADIAMGKAEFLLSGTEADHNYNLDCAAGQLKLGDSTFTGLASERIIKNGTDSTFDLSCAMGKLSVTFMENAR